MGVVVFERGSGGGRDGGIYVHALCDGGCAW